MQQTSEYKVMVNECDLTKNYFKNKKTKEYYFMNNEKSNGTP